MPDVRQSTANESSMKTDSDNQVIWYLNQMRQEMKNDILSEFRAAVSVVQSDIRGLRHDMQEVKDMVVDCQHPRVTHQK